MVRGASEDHIDEAIEMVMHDRHAQETADLISAQYDERSSMIRSSMDELIERKKIERDELIERLHSAGASEDKVNKGLDELQHKYDMLMDEMQRSGVTDLEAKHAEQQIELRQRQMNELADALKQLAPADIVRQKQEEQAARQAEEMEDMRRALEQEAADRIEKDEEGKDRV